MKTMKRLTPEFTDAIRSSLLAVVVLGGTFGLGACNRHEDPAETAKDMADERAEGNENVREATEDAAENMAEGTSVKEAASDAYKIEAEKIRADYEVAKERCDGVADPDKDKCRKDAEAARDTAMKALDAKRDSAVGNPSAAPMGPS